MQVKLDDEVLFEIDERMIRLLSHDLVDPVAEIKRRLRWIIEHKCDRCFDRLSSEWLAQEENGQSKIANAGVASLPTDKRAFVDLVQALPSYKTRAQREEDAERVRLEQEAKSAEPQA